MAGGCRGRAAGVSGRREDAPPIRAAACSACLLGVHVALHSPPAPRFRQHIQSVPTADRPHGVKAVLVFSLLFTSAWCTARRIANDLRASAAGSRGDLDAGPPERVQWQVGGAGRAGGRKNRNLQAPATPSTPPWVCRSMARGAEPVPCGNRRRNRHVTTERQVRAGRRGPPPGRPSGLWARDMPLNSFGYILIPLEVRRQVQFKAPRPSQPRASTSVAALAGAIRRRQQPRFSLHGKHLRPNRQHADEQRQRRQRGSFLDDGPNHDPYLPIGQNGNDVLILFWCQAGGSGSDYPLGPSTGRKVLR
jgi:hypothetical protein